MSIYTMVIAAICMIIYAIYAVRQISRFENLFSGILGTAAVIAGGLGVYLAVPFIAAIILFILKVIGVIFVIAVVIEMFLN